MTRGPHLNRLHGAVDTALPTVIDEDGVKQWLHAEQLLRNVSEALAAASEKGRAIGGKTGPALAEALLRCATGIDERADLLHIGAEALNDSSVALSTAQARTLLLDQDVPLPPDPGPYQPPADPDADPIKARAEHDTAKQGFQDALDSREAIAQQIADDLDARLDTTTTSMKEIHGLVDLPNDEKEQEGPGDEKGPIVPLKRGGPNALGGTAPTGSFESFAAGISLADAPPGISPAIISAGGGVLGGGLAAGLARSGALSDLRGSLNPAVASAPAALGASSRVGSSGTLGGGAGGAGGGRSGGHSGLGDPVVSGRGRSRRTRDDDQQVDTGDDEWLDDDGVGLGILG